VPNPKPLAVRLRRARPLLGTLVDIGIEADDSETAQLALAAAFAEIATVHRLMSFHEPESDLARLNRARPGEPVGVDPRTAEVLRHADAFRLASGGAFDCAVADTLVASGRLPAMPATQGADAEGPAGDRVLVERGRARLDLGGIAKGYAVDRAIAALVERGVRAALVNAGGDLRHIGDDSVAIRLRDPADPSRLVAAIDIRNAALASSASSGLATAAPTGNDLGSALVDPRCGRTLGAGAGVSIRAPQCMIADALAKVVLVTGDLHHPLLRVDHAEVVLYRAASAQPA
jgi:thiamine biosynthesis lipoprotein